LSLILRAKPADDRGLQEILDGEYALPETFDPGPNPVILDLGANVGAFSLWALHTWSGATIHAYEPNPEHAKMLEANVMGFPVHVHRTAVWLATGKARLFAPKEGMPGGSWSLVDKTDEVNTSQGGLCNVMHAADLPAADILKLYVEGVELDILKAYPHLDKVKAVVLEYHSQADRVAIRELMAAHGFIAVSDKETHWRGTGTQKFMKVESPTLYLAILAGGGKTFGEFETCLHDLERLVPSQGINLIIRKESGTGVDRARNRLVAEALTLPQVTHFMFLDNDIVFDPRWVVHMVRSGLDAVGVAYPRKQIDWEQVARAVKDGVTAADLPFYATSFIFNHVVDNNGASNGRHFEGMGDFVEVEELGTGFLMVRRHVLEKVIAAYKDDISYITDYPPRDEIHHMVFACGPDPASKLERAKLTVLECARKFEDDPGKLADAALQYQLALREGKSALGRYLTEDYRFCRLWRMLGGSIYMFLDATVGHIGLMKFEGQVKRMFKKEDTNSVGRNQG